MKCKLPQFSNEADWELAMFELSLVLDRVWPHKDQLDIVDYMTISSPRFSSSGDMETRADRLIYFALTMAAKKDSFAKLQILASCHRDAVPCVLKNEGKKLYTMFQGMFNMTNLHQASLPTVRTEFYAISQRENESILKYTARVDLIVATMAKLGERVSSSAWIYALGNGLRAEFKECKDGVLYSKPGYQTVLEVKNKLLSEEAVLSSQSQKTPSTRSNDDEIALSTLKLQNPKKSSLKKTDKTVTFTPPPEPEHVSDTAPSDKALWTKGKKGKSHTKGKGKTQPGSWDHEWTPAQTWPLPSKGKGRGKGKGSSSWDSQPLWCDIHQCYGHSTDWCYDNPHRTGGKPIPNDALWCESCNRSGHTAAMCYATTIRTPQGKGASTSKGGKNKGHNGDRNWKSQNFPANYQSEQASPALHDNTPSPTSQEWLETHEVGSVTIDHIHPTFFLEDADDDEVAAYIDQIILAIQHNMERQHQYTQLPSPQLRQDTGTKEYSV